MKWLVILLFLPLFSFGQIHKLDWYAHEKDTRYHSPLLWNDAEGNVYCLISNNTDTITIKGSYKTVKTKNNGQYQILKEDPNGNKTLIPLLKNELIGFNFFLGKDHIYFIWDIDKRSNKKLSDTLKILDSTFYFTNQPQNDFPVQILKVSKNLDKVYCNRLKVIENDNATYSFSRAKENSEGNLVLFFYRQNAINSPKDSVIIENSVLKYGLSEYGRDMVLLNENIEFEKASVFERFIPPIGVSRRSTNSPYNINYFISSLEDSKGGKNEYLFGRINNDLNIDKIDTLVSNLNLYPAPGSQCEAFDKLYCFGVANEEYFNLNNDTIENKFGTSTKVFFEIDSTGKTNYIGQFEGLLGSSMSLFDNVIWFKLYTRSRTTVFLNQTLTANNWDYEAKDPRVAWYIAINDQHKIVKSIQGPVNDQAHSYSTIYEKNKIHDINYTTHNYRLEDKKLEFDTPSPMTTQIGVFKNSVIYSVSPQFRPKLSYRYINCNSIEINYNKTDADHFLIIHSRDSSFSLPKDNENYNYSTDFLIAPKLGNDQIIYQGADSSLTVKNLPSNRKNYFLIVPGNGVSGATTYNVDSVDTIEVYIPAISKAKLRILPSKDTATCQSDTIFAKATSTYPIRWMDGKTENQRFVPETGDYYFTVKDSQGCVLSSDTVTITKHPTPEINRIEASQKPPFCLGDSVWFAANSFVLGAHPDSVKYASKAMKTGWYTVKLTNRFDCQSTDSIYVEFGQKPTFKFLQDSVLSFDNKLRAKYSTNADSLLWVYGLDSANGYTNYVVTDSQYLFINAIDQSGCNIWDSILTMYKEPISEAFPNAFSPNGDGINDVWYFIHPDTAGVLTIYDRWGGIVYSGQNQWDGKKHGETLPIGAYRYTFRFTENGVEKVKLGLISLIK